MTTNLKGTFLCSKAVLPAMIKQQYGRIVNLSSVSAKRGGESSAAPTTLRQRQGFLGLRRPWQGRSRLMESPSIPWRRDLWPRIYGVVSNPRKQKEMSVDIPCQRLGTPEDVAAAIAFLASEEAGYITGEEIDINGGSTWIESREAKKWEAGGENPF